MTAQKYIQSELDQLTSPIDATLPPKDHEMLANAVYKLLASTKFRKYALSPEYAQYVKDAVHASVAANEPINIVFFGGCYKLWRLDEAPEADWAELFAYMYFTRWLKPICAIYKPGVWFDFLLDDYIVPRLNNIPEADVETYRASRAMVLSFIKPYQPDNLTMTHTSEGGLFATRKEYENSLEQAIKEVAGSLPGGLPNLSEAEAASVELNTRTTPEQLADPKWREKVELLHSSYYVARNKTGYYAPETHKIIAFTQPFAPGKPLAVGSTSHSVAKYWVGTGVLKPRNDGSLYQTVLSPNQLKSSQFDWHGIEVPGLTGKNFSKIRVLK
jgi:hypothetical protein